MQTHKYENMEVEFRGGIQAARERRVAAASAQGRGRRIDHNKPWAEFCLALLRALPLLL